MKKYGVGIVGTGWVSGEHIRAYTMNPHTEVTAITSRQKAKGRAKADEYGLTHCRIYTDYDEMLKEDDMCIVSICTPNFLHAEQTIKAAEAGKNILIEKPVALTIKDMVAMRRAVNKAKVKTLVGFVLRWNPLFETVKALIADGALGKIFYAETDYLHNVTSSYPCYPWTIKKSLAGSAWLVGGCHAIDAIRWFLQDEAVEVTAYSGGYRKDFDYDSTAVMIIKFNNGAIGKIGASHDCVMPYIFNIELYGDNGTIRNNKLYSNKFPGQTDFIEIPTVCPDSGEVSHHPFADEINHFVSCIMNDKESHVNLEDGLKTHEICIAAEISAKENRQVKLPLPELWEA